MILKILQSLNSESSRAFCHPYTPEILFPIIFTGNIGIPALLNHMLSLEIQPTFSLFPALKYTTFGDA
jgi:hypothetical protein